ncbi:hypothetical protein BUALT_BualtUnG0028100 [Buddleja alternifolia]|uniref:Uncharacterized protein n=1 Tax=Buddleja alternifolia TaxID=168488 RepID=A0AAV6W7B0_9LAMI|nr:hypothetical protein BUALT_BualtUnG0028100 [Buddleja alternifolia]
MLKGGQNLCLGDTAQPAIHGDDPSRWMSKFKEMIRAVRFRAKMGHVGAENGVAQANGQHGKRTTRGSERRMTQLEMMIVEERALRESGDQYTNTQLGNMAQMQENMQASVVAMENIQKMMQQQLQTIAEQMQVYNRNKSVLGDGLTEIHGDDPSRWMSKFKDLIQTVRFRAKMGHVGVENGVVQVNGQHGKRTTRGSERRMIQLGKKEEMSTKFGTS